MPLPYPQHTKPYIQKKPLKPKVYSLDDLLKLQEEEEEISKELEYVRQNQRLPGGETPEQEFVNRNVDIESYAEQLESKLSEIAAQREEMAKKVERKTELKQAETEDVENETQRLLGMTPAQIGKERKRQKDLDSLIEAQGSRVTDLQLKDAPASDIEREQHKLDVLVARRNKMAMLPYKKSAEVYRRHVSEDWEQLAKEQTEAISTIQRNLEKNHPDWSRQEIERRAWIEYQESFPKALEPSGAEALMRAAPNLSIDWETFTIFDSKLKKRRKMTTEEGAKYAAERQVLYSPQTTRQMLKAREEPQKNYDFYKGKMTTLEAKRAALFRRRAEPKAKHPLTEDTFQSRLQQIDKQIEDLTPDLEKAEAELARHPDPSNLSLFMTPEKKPGGTIVENWYQHKLRRLSTFASMGTAALIRELSYVSEDPDKPKSEFGTFEILPDSPALMRTEEQGGLKGGQGLFGWWDSEASSAATATMPMFSTFTKHYPGIVHGGTGTRAAAAFLAGIGDIVIPVGPEAVGIAASPFTGGLSLGLTAGAKTGKGALRAAKRIKDVPAGTKFSVPGLRKYEFGVPKKLQTKINKKGIEKSINLLNKIDRVGYGMLTGGFSELNKSIASAVVKANTVRQINRALDNKPASYKDVLNPIATPSTVRERAAQKVAEQLSPSVGAQVAISKRVARGEEGLSEFLNDLKTKYPEGTATRTAIDDLVKMDAITPADVGKAFRKQATSAAKELDDGILKGALLVRERIASLLDDAVSGAETAKNQYTNLFIKRLYANRMLKRDFADQVKRFLSKQPSAKDSDLWNTFDDFVLSKATDSEIQQATAQTIRDFVEVKLFNRAPNNMVFFSRDLLIDEKLATDPMFAATVAERSKRFYDDVSISKGNVTYSNGQDLASLIIKNKGPSAFRRSPEWRGIVRKLLQEEGLDLIENKLVTDQIASFYGKQVAREWVQEGPSLTRQRDFTTAASGVEVPAGTPFTERAFRYATGTERERRPFAFGTDIPRRLGMQTDIITQKDLARASRSVFNKYIRPKTPVLKSNPPSVSPQTPVGLQNLLKEGEGIGGQVYAEVQTALKNKETISDLIDDTIKMETREANRNLLDAIVRRQTDDIRTPEQFKELLKSQGLSRFIDKLPDDELLSLTPAGEFTQAARKDFVDAIAKSIQKEKQVDYLNQYLQTFFMFVKDKKVRESLQSNLKTHVQNYVDANPVVNLESLLEYVRTQSPQLRGRGMQVFLGTKDAYAEAALASLINTRTNLRQLKLTRRFLNQNPELRFELIPSSTAERAGKFMWNGTYGFRTNEVLDGIIREHGADLSVAEVRQLKESEKYKAAIRNINNAYQHVHAKFNDPSYAANVLKEMLTEGLTTGREGIDRVFWDTINTDTVFSKLINDAGDQLGRAIRSPVERSQKHLIDVSLDLKQQFPRDEVLVREGLLRQRRISKRNRQKDIRKDLREKNKIIIKDLRDNLMEEMGLHHPMPKAKKKILTDMRREKMKRFDTKDKEKRKSKRDEQTIKRIGYKEEQKKQLGILPRIPKDVRKKKYKIVKDKMKEWELNRTEVGQERYKKMEASLKNKYDIPTKKLTSKEFEEIQKKYVEESKRYNKETFLERGEHRRREIDRLLYNLSPFKRDETIEDLVVSDAMQKLDEIEAAHSKDRAARRKRIWDMPIPEQKKRSQIYGYHRQKYFEKWDQIDDYTIKQYVHHTHPDLGENAKRALYDTVKEEIREWDALWGMERRNARIEHMNKKRLEWGQPVVNPEKLKSFKEELKAYRKSERTKFIEERKAKREELKNKEGLVRTDKDVLKIKREELRERMLLYRAQQKVDMEDFKTKQREERVAYRDQIEEGLGIIPKMEGKKKRAKQKLIAEKIKERRDKLQDEMDTFKAEQSVAIKDYAIQQRQELGLKRRLTKEETEVLKQQAAESKEALEEGLLGLQTEAALSFRKEALHPADPRYAFNPDVHPLNDLKNKLIARLEDRGINIDTNVGTTLEEFSTLLARPSPDIAVLMGPGFKNKWDKAHTALRSEQLKKSLEMFAARDEGFGRFLANSVERMRQIQTSGLLGGYGTTRYAGLNLWSAPAMMMMTRGVAGTADDLISGASRWFRNPKSPDEIMFTDVKGKPWTFREIADAESRNPLYASASAAEMDTGNIQFLMEVMAGHGGRKWYRGWSALAARNNVARFADFTDSILRRSVFRNGLKRGLTEAQAAREAKDALFDYTKARSNKLNRVIGQGLMFWTFQAENIRSLLDAFSRGQARPVIHTYRALRKMSESQGLDAQGSNMDMARVYRYIHEGFEDNPAVAAGFSVPALEAFGILAEGIGTVVAPMVGDATLLKAGKRQYDIILNRAQFRPLLKEGLKWAQENKLDAQEGFYVPNSYVSGLPEPAWETLKEWDWIRKVNVDDRKKGKATREGEHWRFKDQATQRNFDRLTTALFALGLRRSIEDNLIKARAEGLDPVKGRVTYPYSELGGLWDAALYISAVKTHLGKPDPEKSINIIRKRTKSAIQTKD